MTDMFEAASATADAALLALSASRPKNPFSSSVSASTGGFVAPRISPSGPTVTPDGAEADHVTRPTVLPGPSGPAQFMSIWVSREWMSHWPPTRNVGEVVPGTGRHIPRLTLLVTPPPTPASSPTTRLIRASRLVAGRPSNRTVGTSRTAQENWAKMGNGVGVPFASLHTSGVVATT